ncbi:MAG: thymidine phosphorylase [Clostridia bacterium]|nr:thymidine phosphorylase [Clostridia bacterium]
MRATDIIMKKRLGGELSAEEIQAFVRGATDGSFEDYQLSALLMAICMAGMTDRETVDLTMSMARSGETLDLSSIPGAKVDKHSTGGVGDTTTLIVAPLAAACGAKVAKMSGRGLGFTGGTLDKLESIPGMRVDLSRERFIEQVKAIGIAVIGQTSELAPADRTLYALRDVTATVDSLPLVTSSILSKKIAAGCDAVVLDVKTGSGAVMPTAEMSVKLAETMVRIGSMTGRRFSALVTDMDQPLGMNVGNALEVREAIDALCGRADGALLDVSLQLGAQMLRTAGLADSARAATARLREKLANGEGLKKLAEMIEAQGGDPRVAQDPDRLPKAEARLSVGAPEGGYIAAMKTSDIGYAAQALGAGRVRKGDRIDPAVGLVMKKRVGDPVEKGEIWCELHVNPASDVAAARRLLEGALTVSPRPVAAPELVHAVIE